jgi:Putative peptidoglycan binding domain
MISERRINGGRLGTGPALLAAEGRPLRNPRSISISVKATEPGQSSAARPITAWTRACASDRAGTGFLAAKWLSAFASFQPMKNFWLLWILFLHSVTMASADPQIAAAQESLKSQGFYRGEISGENNNQTAAAITRFQVRRGLEVTGELNEETLRALGVDPSQADGTGPKPTSQPRAEPWRTLREQDRQFLKQLTSGQPTEPAEQVPTADSLDQIRDFIAGFVVVGINPDVEEELKFYAAEADYYDDGVVSKDFIRRDILRYNQKWPIRRYWLVGDVRVLSALEADPVEVEYQIRYFVQDQQRESRGTAIKTLKLQRSPDGFQITSVREKTFD